MSDVVLVGGEVGVTCKVGEEGCVFGRSGWVWAGGGECGQGGERAGNEEDQEAGWWGHCERRSEMQVWEDRRRMFACGRVRVHWGLTSLEQSWRKGST